MEELPIFPFFDIILAKAQQSHFVNFLASIHKIKMSQN